MDRHTSSLILTLVFSALFILSLRAAPAEDNSTNSIKSSAPLPFANTTTLNQLLSHPRTVPFGILLINSTDFMNYALKSAESLVSSSLQHPNITAVDNEIMREELSGLSLFVQEAQNARRLVAAIDAPVRNHFLLIGTKGSAVQKFMRILRRHNTTVMAEYKIVPTEEHKLIEQALVGQGVGNYEKQLKEREVAMLQELYNHVKRYIDGLKGDHRVEEQAMIEWYEQHKNILDNGRKNEIYKKFSKLYALPKQDNEKEEGKM